MDITVKQPKYYLDPDVVIMLSSPLVLGILLWFLPDHAWGFAVGIFAAIFFYQCLVFRQRKIYGFSGLLLITPPSLAILTFTALIAFPSIYICSIKDNPAVYPYYFSIILFYVFFPLGLVFGNKLRKIDLPRLNRLRTSPFTSSDVDKLMFELLIVLLIVGGGIFAVYMMRVKTIPLFELLTNPGAAAKFSLLREEALKLLKVTFVERYLFLWERSIIMPFGIIASFFLYMVYRTKKYLILAVVFFSSGLFFNALTLEKSPTAAIFMAIMAFFYLRQQKFRLRFILLSLVIIFIIPITILYLKYYVDHEDIITYILISLSNRIFVIPAEALYYYFEIFPAHHEFLMGRSSQMFSWIHFEGNFPLSNYVGQYWFRNPHTTVSANANYIGNFWADFGMPGVIISSFFVGWVIHWIYWKILQVADYQKNVIFVVLSTITVPIFTIRFLSANFTTILLSSGLLLLILFLIFVWRFLRRYIVSH